jgi:hypothetical protein
MEPEAKAELVKARDTLQRQLQILGNLGSPRAIARKLRIQLREINELLESEGTGDTNPRRSDVLRRPDLQPRPWQPLSRRSSSLPQFIEGMSFRAKIFLCLMISGGLIGSFESTHILLGASMDAKASLIALTLLAIGLFGLKHTRPR